MWFNFQLSAYYLLSSRSVGSFHRNVLNGCSDRLMFPCFVQRIRFLNFEVLDMRISDFVVFFVVFVHGILLDFVALECNPIIGKWKLSKDLIYVVCLCPNL